VTDLQFDKNPQFKQLLSGDFLNAKTTGAFMAEVFRETISPGGIAARHFREGQSEWPSLAQATKADNRKRGSEIFARSGAVKRAISQSGGSLSLKDWGSSADIFSTSRGGKKRLSASGIYASLSVSRTHAYLTVGFEGKYKHSSQLNKARRDLAKELFGQQKLTAKQVRRAVSVSQAERKLAAINADRKARGLKTFRKTAAMGAKGISGHGFELSRGKDNMAYADIVQRGKFHGIRAANGALFSPKGISARARRGMATTGRLEFGVARPLLPFKTRDTAAIERALERGLKAVASAMNK